MNLLNWTSRSAVHLYEQALTGSVFSRSPSRWMRCPRSCRPRDAFDDTTFFEESSTSEGYEYLLDKLAGVWEGGVALWTMSASAG